MSCDRCRQVRDITDLTRIYSIVTCECGRRIKIRRPGEHGIGINIETGDEVVIPAEALKLAVNPLKSTGQFTRAGIAWFAEQVFSVEIGGKSSRGDMTAAIQSLIDGNEQSLKSSEQLRHIDFSAADADDQIHAILGKDSKSVDWWNYMSATAYSLAIDSIKRGQASEAAWAMAVGERFRAIAIFKLHFEEVVFMGTSARRLLDLIGIWDASRENGSEEFWQTVLASHAYAIGQLFSAPVTLIKEKAYVGGMTLDRTDARLLDFMLSGAISGDAILLEIKTPKTRLLGGQYRTNAFSPSTDLGGAVVQVNDYCQSFRENLPALAKGLGRELTAFNPRRVVLIGDHERELDDSKKRASFELFRGSIVGVEIVTFDEFFRKIENLAKLFNLVRKGTVAGPPPTT